MRILVSALDWGLGHTTRMIPLMGKLIAEGNELIFAGSDRQIRLCKEIFPNIETVHSPSCSPVYSKRSSQFLAILKFMPRFIVASIREKRKVNILVREYGIEQIISDNRYGFFSNKVKSILVTHQLQLKLPAVARFLFLSPLLGYLTRQVINKFNECWVPDSFSLKLSGELAHSNVRLKIPIKYIGILSRFSILKEKTVPNIPDILVIISGPEKQRTIFEQKIYSVLLLLKKSYSFLIIRGLPGDAPNNMANSINNCSSAKLKYLLQNSKHIICRSGYTSLMDLQYLNRKALLVPTPGQTEQEYLANYASKEFGFTSINQNRLSKEVILEYLNGVL